jgi:hypothetical protein
MASLVSALVRPAWVLGSSILPLGGFPANQAQLEANAVGRETFHFPGDTDHTRTRSCAEGSDRSRILLV